METLQLACQEAEFWKIAQMVETTFTAEENNQTIAPLPAVPVLTSQWRFQVDASWSEESNGIGMGFVLFEQELEVLHKDNEKGHKQNHHYTQRQKAYVGR